MKEKNLEYVEYFQRILEVLHIFYVYVIPISACPDKVECVIPIEDKKGLEQIQIDRTQCVAAGKVSATKENKVTYLFDIQVITKPSTRVKEG